MKRLGLLFAIAACGGSSPKSKEPMVITECAAVAAHVSEAVFTWKQPPPTTRDAVARVIDEHCEADKWTPEAKACFKKITDEESAKPCVTTLSEDQHTKVMNAMEATFEKQKPSEAAPAAAPPPVGGAPSKGADPCEGGE
jgi:hypothetical protein